MRIGTFSRLPLEDGFVWLGTRSLTSSHTGMSIWTRALRLVNSMMPRGWGLFLGAGRKEEGQLSRRVLVVLLQLVCGCALVAVSEG